MSNKIGIMGGSGLYDFAELEDKKIIEAIEGPFGKPSNDILRGKLEDIEIFFLPRHGKDHSISPSNIPFFALPFPNTSSNSSLVALLI